MVKDLKTIVSSKTQSVEICRSDPVVVIGERINPTGRKKMLNALQEGDFDIVRTDAINQVNAGAKILDVNAGVPGADEPALLEKESIWCSILLKLCSPKFLAVTKLRMHKAR